MTYRTFGCGLWAACLLSLTGCAQLQQRLEAEVETQQNIARICADPELADVISGSQYKADLSDLVVLEFGIDVRVSNGQKQPVVEALATIQSDLNKIYRVAPPETQKDIDAVVAKVHAIRQSASDLRTSVVGAFDRARAQHVSSIKDLTQYQTALRAVIPQVRSEFLSIETNVNQLVAMLGPLARSIQGNASKFQSDDRAEVSDAVQAVGRLPDDTRRLVSSIKDAITNVEQVVDRTWEQRQTTVYKDQLKSTLDLLVRDLVNYETARLLTRAISRQARSLEYKLDQIDEKTWFIASAIWFAGGNDVEKAIARKLHETYVAPVLGEKSGLSKMNLKIAFVAAACEQLRADSATSPTNAVRASALLQPFYEAIVEGLDEPSPTQVAFDLNTVIALNARVLSDTPLSATTPFAKLGLQESAAPRPKTFNERQIRDAAARVKEKLRDTSANLQRYREKRYGVPEASIQ